MSLKPYLYTSSLTDPVAFGIITGATHLRILWEIPGGVQAIEFDYGRNATEAYQFYKQCLGYRVCIMDHFFDRPVAEGWVYGIALSKFGCRVLCKGSWFRHFDEFDDTDYSLAQTSSAIIKSSLTNFVPVISSNQSHIAETSFTLAASGSWALSEYGLYPGDLIQKLASMSNSDYQQWNYWVQSSPFANLLPQLPVAHFEEQVDDGTFHWQVTKKDMTGDSMSQERNLEELANRVLVIYRDIAGGDQALTAWATDTVSQASFWTRDVVLTGGEMVPVGATQYRDLMLAKYKDPMLKNAFTIGSRGIRDSGGARWPLWYPIKNGGGYLRINDLFPDSLTFDKSVDRQRIGQIMTAEYDDTAHTLRISLDTTDESADRLLAQMAAFL